MTERITPLEAAIKISAAVAAASAGEPLQSPSGRLRKLPKAATIADRLASGSVQMPNGCLEWKGARNPNGYGCTKISGKSVFAHRLAFEIAFGPVPAGHHVCHKCDNPSCIDPDHLFAGTCAENIADMVSKGRQTKGEKNPRAKLTESNVQEIRRLILAGVRRADIAARFGVLPNHIGNIQRGLRWTAANALAARENTQ